MDITNKLYDYGLKAGNVAKIVSEPHLEMFTPQSMLVPGSAYYWQKDSPYFIAVVDIVLQHSQEARIEYQKAVETVALPGLQKLITKANIDLQDKIVKQGQEWGPVYEQYRQDAYEQYKDNSDWLYFNKCIHNFIRVGFNRQIDRDNEKYKVKAETSIRLYLYVITRAIAEYCKVNLENWNKYRPDSVDRIMKGHPTNRKDRKLRTETIRTYRRIEWTLRHNDTLLKYAEQWYKCRVNPGSIESYIDELAKDDKYLERSNIETAIAPYDEATGYPRKWRK